MKVKRNIEHMRLQHREVSEHKRGTSTVSAHYTGMGPNKPVPNIPQGRLMEWLRSHGAQDNELMPIYWATFKETLKTHDLINKGLLSVDNYLAALNKGKG